MFPGSTRLGLKRSWGYSLERRNSMKKFLRFIGELKSWGCLSFTGALCIYMLDRKSVV